MVKKKKNSARIAVFGYLDSQNFLFFLYKLINSQVGACPKSNKMDAYIRHYLLQSTANAGGKTY